MDFSHWTTGIEFGCGLRADVGAFLGGNNRPGTLAHVEKVALEQGTCFYLNHLPQNAIGPPHPWARPAPRELEGSS